MPETNQDGLENQNKLVENQNTNISGQDTDIEDDLKSNPKVYSYIQKLRNEAKEKRILASNQENELLELRKLKEEKLSAEEKLKLTAEENAKKATLAEAKARDLEIELLVAKQAYNYKFADLETVMLIVNKKITGEQNINEGMIKQALEEIVKEKPFLVQANAEKKVFTVNAGDKKKIDTEAGVTGNEVFGNLLKNFKSNRTSQRLEFKK